MTLATNTTIVVLADKKEILYQILENSPGFCKIIIVNLKWRSNIIKKLVENEDVSIVDVENPNELASVLNAILWNGIKTEAAVFISQNKIPFLIKINTIIQNIKEKSIYIEDNIFGFHNNKELIKNVWFHKENDPNIMFGLFIIDLMFKLNYTKTGNLELTNLQQETLRKYQINLSLSLENKDKPVKNNDDELTIILPSSKNSKLIRWNKRTI